MIFDYYGFCNGYDIYTVIDRSELIYYTAVLSGDNPEYYSEDDEFDIDSLIEWCEQH